MLEFRDTTPVPSKMFCSLQFVSQRLSFQEHRGRFCQALDYTRFYRRPEQ
ncbi:putative disease resistance RPP13-like protein 1 isoform X1 [Iris pallida]|uniref:Disease resistance RPP13-like protein 1 isoform X1 n=1 Tax=Iris pallida TaxID=29817 RepID=A0AAX6HDS1_IRIPA|nr:putative disease resistance RPP13-like protein 1 isoform X1 [Iris pallida]